jgi:hypothetical protein
VRRSPRLPHSAGLRGERRTLVCGLVAMATNLTTSAPFVPAMKPIAASEGARPIQGRSRRWWFSRPRSAVVLLPLAVAAVAPGPSAGWAD